MNRFTVIAVAAAGLGVSPGASSQAFPSRPVHIVTQFNAGSSGDGVFRVIAPEWSRILGQPVVIDNRPGGGGMLAAVAVTRAEPDGHTVLGATGALAVTHKFLARNMEIDPLTDLTPISKVGESVSMFSVSAKVPVKSMKELIEYARLNPGKVNYGTSGIGSSSHLAGEQINQIAGIRMIHVPYKASSTALLDAVSGQITSSFSIYTVTAAHIQSGSIRPMAVVREARFSGLPDVPTLTEAVPGFQNPPSWVALFGPARLPEALLGRLHASVAKAISSPDARAKLAATGFEVESSTPQQLADLMKRETELVAGIVKSAGIKPR